jgi:mannose-1-phosphate guanylyltransferase
MAEAKHVALILAGGSGTRFWPLSRASLPKQYLTLFGKRSLIQHTWDRLLLLCKPKDVFVCSSAKQGKHLKAQIPRAKVVLEPSACNTGPAVLLSMLELLKRGYSPSTVVGVFPADHYIVDVPAFQRVLNQAFEVAQTTGGLVTLGIVPESPHTGYGYIEAKKKKAGHAEKVVQFVEKPEREKAEAFVKSGRFYWNSGVFIWQLGAILEAFRILAPKEYELFSQARTKAALSKAYQSVTPLPVDKMILEKASNVYVVPAEMGWSDVGSWNSLHALKPKDANGNCVDSNQFAGIDSNDCLVIAPGKTVALVGIENAIVVAQGDQILICARPQDQKVRKAAELLDA